MFNISVFISAFEIYIPKSRFQLHPVLLIWDFKGMKWTMALNCTFERTCVSVHIHTHILYSLLGPVSMNWVRKKKKTDVRQTLNLNHLLKVQNKTDFSEIFPKRNVNILPVLRHFHILSQPSSIILHLILINYIQSTFTLNSTS